MMWGTIPRLLRASTDSRGAALLAAATSVCVPSLLSLQLAFAQHQAEMAKMGEFDKVCAEKLEWYGSLMRKFLSWCFTVVVKITKYQSIVSQDTQISSWIVQGILFNTRLHGCTLFPSHKTVFSRPWEES